MTSNFDRQLERQLEDGFRSVSSRPVPGNPRYVTSLAGQAAGTALLSRLWRWRVAVSLASLLAVSSGGAAVAAAATGTNPIVLGAQVSTAVVACPGQMARGEQSLGDCLSTVVQAGHPAPASGIVPQTSSQPNIAPTASARTDSRRVTSAPGGDGTASSEPTARATERTPSSARESDSGRGAGSGRDLEKVQSAQPRADNGSPAGSEKPRSNDGRSFSPTPSISTDSTRVRDSRQPTNEQQSRRDR